MKKYLLIFACLFLTKAFSQTKTDTISYLETVFIVKINEYKNQPVKKVLENLPYEIKGYTLTPCPPSTFKDTEHGIPAVETLKTESIILYFNNRTNIEVEDILKNKAPNINEISKTEKQIKSTKNIYLEISLNDIDNHPYFGNPILDSALEGNNWSETVRKELMSEKYTVKNIKLSFN